MFTIPLSDLEAYWVGYLRADGCLSKQLGAVLFGQKHSEPVQAFADFIGSDKKIGYTEGFHGYGWTSGYRMSSTKFFNELMSLGVKSILYPPLYEDLNFWRGLLDGDGSIGFQRNGNRIYPTIRWSGSYEDMFALSLWLSRLMSCQSPKLVPIKSIYTVNYNGSKARFLAEYLYKNHYSALSYKREAAEKILDWSSNHGNSKWKPPRHLAIDNQI